jgi:hypothetical protein
MATEYVYNVQCHTILRKSVRHGGREGGMCVLRDILTSCVHSLSQHTHTHTHTHSHTHFTPSWRASDTPIMLIASSMLLQILAACPAPLSPQCITALPIHSRRGVARSHDSLDPPTMKVRIPLVAAPTPGTENRDQIHRLHTSRYYAS